MIKPHNKGTLLNIHVKPRSKKQVIILEEEVCFVHVKAAATRNQANIEVLRVLGKKLDIPTQSIRIISGEKASKKIVLILDMPPKSVLAALIK